MDERSGRVFLTRTLTVAVGDQLVTRSVSADIDVSEADDPLAMMRETLDMLARQIGEDPEAAGSDLTCSRDVPTGRGPVGKVGASPTGVVRGSTDGITPRV